MTGCLYVVPAVGVYAHSGYVGDGEGQRSHEGVPSTREGD